MKRYIFCALLLTSIVSVISQVERDDIDKVYKWDLSDLYPSDDSWNEAKEALKQKLQVSDTWKGTVTTTAKQLLEVLVFDTNFKIDIKKVLLYALLKADMDTRDLKNQGLFQEGMQIWTEYETRTAYVKPEILAADWQLIDGFLKIEPGLQPYEFILLDMFRMKEHILEEEEGRIYALSSMLYRVPSSVYNTFINAEMPNPVITLSNGEEITLSMAEYTKYRALPIREDRALVFQSFFGNMENFQGTLGELLNGGVKKDVFRSRAQHYENSLEAALDKDNIPVDVYHALINNANNNLEAFHRYLGIKKRMMGLDTLKYIDLYAPVVQDVNLSYDFSEAQEIISSALAPLGKEYVSVVKRSFNERWIDVYPSTGKYFGAYSIDYDYYGHPYMLLNYNGLYEGVSTAAHELGHTMQSFYSIKKQPFPTSEYPIFTAEVASTLNEVLLFDYMLKEIKDVDIKISLLMQWLDVFKGTLFRQTQFAEFELKIHKAVENGTPLTGEYLSELYLKIVRKYYGHEQGVCMVDDFIHMEWAYIAHFYSNYYVYQYSTSFTASVSLAKSILAGKEGARDRYLDFLSAGGSDYPIALLRKAGVDMTGSDVFNSTISAMNQVMDEIDRILGEK